MNKIKLKRGGDRRLLSGHLWIFSNEIEKPEFDTDKAQLVSVVDFKDNDLGLAFYNHHSLIALRLLGVKEFNYDTIKGRIQLAYNYRKATGINLSIFRLVFGESDLLPGLVIDKYDNYFSLQILSAGMELFKEEVIKALLELFPDTKGIIEKNNSYLRQLEGLEHREVIVFGEIPDRILTEENSLKLSISLKSGQKTGYYLDQKLNRLSIRHLCKDAVVLDCFCNQGGFALNAAYAGAKEVTGVDISDDAIDLAKENARLNDLDNIEFVKADVFDYLQGQINNKNKWDVVVLDPPAFTKSKKTIKTAIKGYAKINRMALSIIRSGGYLVSSSCSQHIDENTFLDLINTEAAKQGKQLKIYYRGMQSPDHPVLISMPETKYLKFFIFKII